MIPEKIKDVYSDFKKALRRLDEAAQQPSLKSSVTVDGTIQRFEFTFELAWKLTKLVLEHNGIEAGTPRLVIKEAFKAGILKNGIAWIHMLEDRNKTSHIYDEEQAFVIYKKVKGKYLKLFKIFCDEIEKNLR